MKEITLKKLMQWFLGETASRTLVIWWHWLWKQGIARGDHITLEAAKDSLASMQRSVDELTRSVAQVSAVYQQAQAKYCAHQAEYDKANQQAVIALEQGNEQAARLALARAITLEKAIPNLEKMADQSRQLLKQSRQELQIEQEKLEGCRFEMGNLEAIAEMNEALSKVMKLTGGPGETSATSAFNSAGKAIKNKNLEVIAQRELSENPTAKLARELDGLSQSDAIEKRLNQLRNQKKGQLETPQKDLKGNE
ncbi:MAG: PspA/IM30 family protein [Acaryochloridaceae cyanobacterium RL_2_7]|nr:PspA/IM30 family protein [Acaryochloridaceae cyanobacterium RL_2_7]